MPSPGATLRLRAGPRGQLHTRSVARTGINGLGAAAGFTLLEMLVVAVMIIIIAAVGIPALNQQMVRGRLMGAVEQVATHLHQARLTAMRQGFPVVVRPDYDGQRLLAFLNDQNAANLTQDAGEVTVFNLAVPGDLTQTAVYFMGPDLVVGTSSVPAQSVDGLTDDGTMKVAVFEPDGSIRDLGAFRLADGRTPVANVFEIRIEPAATARIEVRKWIYGGAGGGGVDAWIPLGGGAWQWYW